MPAVADSEPNDKDAKCRRARRFCVVEAQSREVIGSRPSTSDASETAGRPDGKGEGAGGAGGLCRTAPAVPQPPKSDAVWQGNQDGVIQMRTCFFNWSRFSVSESFWTANEEEAVEAIDPIVLAAQARDSLELPRPALERSPAAATWVNENTWVWLQGGWSDLSATARSGAVWATVTAAPLKTNLSAGDAAQAVSCPGPGRAWTPADGSGDTGNGACVLNFDRSGQVTVAVSVPYEVTWTGSGGASGDFGVMTATGEESVQVLEGRSVNRS